VEAGKVSRTLDRNAILSRLIAQEVFCNSAHGNVALASLHTTSAGKWTLFLEDTSCSEYSYSIT